MYQKRRSYNSLFIYTSTLSSEMTSASKMETLGKVEEKIMQKKMRREE